MLKYIYMDDAANKVCNRKVSGTSFKIRSRRSSVMLGIKRYVAATVGLILMALPATALAADHHWDHHWVRDHHGFVVTRPGFVGRTPYVAPRYAYSGTPYVAPRYAYSGVPYAAPGYAYQGTPYVAPGYAYQGTPYVTPYASASTGNLSYLMEKRQEAMNAIAAANRSGNTAGAHRMWEVYNSYNQRIAAAGGGALRY
jgi:hypothetical protein